MSAWTYCHSDGKAAPKIVPPRLRIPYWKGPSAESEEKHEPVSDIDTAVVDSLKALDPKRPIREADSCSAANSIRTVHCWGIRQRVRESEVAKNLLNKLFSRITVLNVSPDRRNACNDRQLVGDGPVTNTKHHQILVVGGGTVGVTVAASLRRRGPTPLDIAIVEPSEIHYY